MPKAFLSVHFKSNINIRIDNSFRYTRVYYNQVLREQLCLLGGLASAW